MAQAQAHAFSDHMQLLFDVGTCAGLSDGQLLERFLAGRDDAGELAFEALVARHGPMVMRVCRNGINDPHDVHDAFQAVFLVLARRAKAIRQRDSVASWLYGVALRVNARSKMTAIRRQIRERRTIGVAQTIATRIPGDHQVSPVERDDHAAVVHQELDHLPEKYRAPVVLCYLEGLTHDEAAARLSWPVGTVRSRLARARDRLRTRLRRRGVAAPASIGPMAQWLMAAPGPSSRLIATVSVASSAPISRELLKSIARSVADQTTRTASAAAPIPSTSLLLAQGVLHMMLIKRILIAASALLPLSMTAVVSGMFLAQATRPQIQSPFAPPAAPNPPPATAKDAPTPPDDIDRLAQKLVEAALQRLNAQRDFYEEGRITIDRFVEASKELELAELRVAKADADRLAVRRRHIDRIREIEMREQAELQVGRGTVADLSEAHHRRIEAELDLLLSQREVSEMAALRRRLDVLERQVEQLKKENTGK